MPRKKRANGDQPIGVGLTAKQLKKKKPENYSAEAVLTYTSMSK